LKATKAGRTPELPPEVACHALRDIRRIANTGSGSTPLAFSTLNAVEQSVELTAGDVQTC